MAGKNSRTEKSAHVHLAADMVAEPWFIAGGLIPQERVQGCTVEKMVDEFFFSGDMNRPLKWV